MTKKNQYPAAEDKSERERERGVNPEAMGEAILRTDEKRERERERGRESRPRASLVSTVVSRLASLLYPEPRLYSSLSFVSVTIKHLPLNASVSKRMKPYDSRASRSHPRTRIFITSTLDSRCPKGRFTRDLIFKSDPSARARVNYGPPTRFLSRFFLFSRVRFPAQPTTSWRLAIRRMDRLRSSASNLFHAPLDGRATAVREC